MRRIRRRTMGVAVGLALGWLAAGYAEGWLPGMGSSVAVAETQHDHSGGETVLTGQEPAGEHGPADEGVKAAEELRPAAGDITWYRPVLWVAAGLFIAAVALGIPALKLRGPLPPDPADTHDDHDAHDAHDDHAPAGGGHDHSHDHAHGGHSH